MGTHVGIQHNLKNQKVANQNGIQRQKKKKGGKERRPEEYTECITYLREIEIEGGFRQGCQKGVREKEKRKKLVGRKRFQKRHGLRRLIKGRAWGGGGGKH